MWSRLIAAVAASVLLVGAAPALAAQSAPAAAPADSQIGRDQAAVDTAQAAFESGAYAGLAGHVDALERVLADMPRPYAKGEVRGGVLYYHADDLADFLGHSTLGPPGGDGSIKSVVWVPQPYSHAAYLLASYYNETGQSARALEDADLGLAAAPHDPHLINEKGAALIVLRRFPEALAVYVGSESEPGMAKLDRARFLRGQGFCLTELHRLDEAERAYRKSLVLEPGHGGAQRELTYIAGLRAGAAPTSTELLTSDQAKKRH